MTDIALSYLVCATPRTGSNFLCEVLSSTGVAGHPEEYFWKRPFWYDRWAVSDFASFIDAVRHHGTTRNGVFGSKLIWDHDIAPLLVTYEEFAAASEVTARQIIAHLGLEAPDRLASGTWRHQRQADTLTDTWTARYKAEQPTSRHLPDDEVLRILEAMPA